jgi:hypothetical protein
MPIKSRITRRILCISLVMFLTIIWALTPSHVFAQCGSDTPPDSTCYTCHLAEKPSPDDSLWHGIHASKDCCARCHGGNCMSMDQDLAHQGIVTNPLSDIYTNCHSCHPDDYQARAELFAAELDFTPSSSPTSTPVIAGESLAKPLVILAAPTPVTHSVSPIPLIFGGLAFITLFLLGLILLITHFRG